MPKTPAAKKSTKKTVFKKKQSVADYPDHAPIFVSADNVGTWRDYEHYVTYIDDYAKELGISIADVKNALKEGYLNLNGSYDANIRLVEHDTIKQYKNYCQLYAPDSAAEIEDILEEDPSVFIQSGYDPVEVHEALDGTAHTELIDKILDEGLLTSKWRNSMTDVSYRMMWDDTYEWPVPDKVVEGYFGQIGTKSAWDNRTKIDDFDIRRYMDRVLYEKHGGIVFLIGYFDSPCEDNSSIQYCKFAYPCYLLVPDIDKTWDNGTIYSPPGVDVTEEECISMMKQMFAGAKELHLKNVTMGTPDGLYYSPHRIVGYKKKKNNRSFIQRLFGRSR